MTRSEKNTGQILRNLMANNSITLAFRTAEFNRISDYIVITNDNKILLIEIKQSDAINFKGLQTRTLDKDKQIEANSKFTDGFIRHIYVICLYSYNKFYMLRDVKPLLNYQKTIIPQEYIQQYAQIEKDTLSELIDAIIVWGG